MVSEYLRIAKRASGTAAPAPSPDTVTLVLVLLCHGCPLQAIVAAFGVDERTVARWQARAGQQCQAIHEHLFEATIGCLTVGAVIRVGGELMARYDESATSAAAIGGTLGMVGFLAFAVVVVGTVGTRLRRRGDYQKSLSGAGS